jgi:hypothetical protein
MGMSAEIVLEIRVERDDDIAPRAGEPGAQGRGLAEVPAEPDDADPRVRSLKTLQDLEAAVGAAVVDEDQLVLVTARQRAGDLLVQRRQVVLLVQQGHHHRNLRLLLVVRCFCHIPFGHQMLRKPLSYRSGRSGATTEPVRLGRIIGCQASAGQLKYHRLAGRLQ